MRFMLLQAYGEVGLADCPPMNEWDPADVRAHIEFQRALNVELLELDFLSEFTMLNSVSALQMFGSS